MSPAAWNFSRGWIQAKLRFDRVEAGMKYVEDLAPGQFAAKAAVNVALLDGAARKAGKPLHDFLGLGFKEDHHVTSFSIGIDKPEVIARRRSRRRRIRC